MTESLNSQGNLIVGYNKERGQRTGSHNLIVGDEHSYVSYGGMIGGFQNTVEGKYASVTGGWENTFQGACSSVSGGSNNTAF